jgi:1-acyl-sn-glycerol-3-phosphate acyltransferase
LTGLRRPGSVGPLPRLIGKLGRTLYVAYAAAVSAAVMMALWLSQFAALGRPRLAVAFQRRAARFLLSCLGVRYTLSGPPPPAEACVLVANHTSYLDIPLMLAALDLDFAFVTKSELLDWPLISRITRAGAHIPVDRERAESRGAVIARMVKRLRKGRSVLVFPEGTFSFDARLRPFHRGAFHAAVAAGVPVVPLATRGVSQVWSQHAAFPRPGRIQVTFGEVIPCAAARGAPGDDPEARADAARLIAERFIAQHAGLPASG